MFLRRLRALGVWLLSAAVKRLYRIVFLLRLYVLLLERDAARAADRVSSQEQEQDQARWQQRVDDGHAWLDFCDSLRGLADYIVSPPHAPQPRGHESNARMQQQDRPSGGSDAQAGVVALAEVDRNEGLRYLTRVLRGGLEAFLDCWDPAWPVLRPLPYNVKMGADNPDNLYMYGTVSGQYQYRLYGKRGSVTYLSFGCYCGSRPGLGSTDPTHLDSSELVTQPDGSFEIFLTPQPRGSNWMRLPPDASRLVVRQTFLDRTAEQPAEVHIERLGLGGGGDLGGSRGGSSSGAPAGEVRPPLSAAQVVSGLAGASLFVSGSVMQFQQWSRSFAQRPNTLFTLDHDVYMTAWADPAIHFFHGYWKLGPGEALVITTRTPECVYWNFQLDNWWMESLDYEAHPATHVNKANAGYMPDGSVCLVVAHEDPRPRAARSISTRTCTTTTTSTTGSSSGSAAAGASGNGDGGGEGGGSLAGLPRAVLAGVTWVDTAHHRHGTMGLRWVRARAHPVPVCRVVRVGPELARVVAESGAVVLGE